MCCSQITFWFGHNKFKNNINTKLIILVNLRKTINLKALYLTKNTKLDFSLRILNNTNYINSAWLRIINLYYSLIIILV